jgi:hypothetical protein
MEAHRIVTSLGSHIYLDNRLKAIRVTAHGGPQDCDKSRFPYFSDARLKDIPLKAYGGPQDCDKPRFPHIFR